MDGHRTGRSHAAEDGQSSDGLGCQSAERSVRTGENRVPDVERGPALPACPDDDGEQLCGTQRVRAEVLEPLARPLGPGKLPNT